MQCRILLLLLVPLFSLGAGAQEAVDKSYGGWQFVSVSHTFASGLSTSAHLERNDLQFRYHDCCFARLSVGHRVLPWLKASINYVPCNNSGSQWNHYAEADLTGMLTSGDLTVSLRERYRHCLTDERHELRSRLTVSYQLADTPCGFYLAPEVFTCGTDWLKSRHYGGFTYRLTPSLQLDTYYMYYAFKSRDPQHVLGLGLNVSL